MHSTLEMPPNCDGEIYHIATVYHLASAELLLSSAKRSKNSVSLVYKMAGRHVGQRWLTETELKKALDELDAGLTDEEESVLESSSDEESSGKLYFSNYLFLCVIFSH